ncbi:ESF1 homolog [Diabrotica virgifera virgifera]|uniref:ESF1 homolog n=2 Tax=Diabrotica virgifera virgifera TaxID=50390 RepID=A0ABM5IJ37_DIAVI|nr:ESF1 homolog [Diabrotica virgifera virgifera]
MEDSRFAHIKTDPKFRRIPKKERKVKIDKRFQSMFKDKQFKVKYTIDKRGRPVNHTSNEDLKRYYELSSESESSVSESESDEPAEVGRYVKRPTDEEDTELKVKDKSDKTLTDDVKKKLRNLSVDYARGESNLLSESSSDDEESDEEVSEAEEIDHKWGELDADAESTDEPTTRLAACNMDWDRMRAIDLMVLFNSFLPPGGVIKSVGIYPSEFGKARMKEEEIKGPTELVQAKVDDEVEDDQEEGSSYHMEKLRQYQLNRLKYYYAIISFDNTVSANKIYTECDGMEYESSAIKMDLRFVPENMEFDDEPKEYCDKLPEVNKYQPRFFTTTALQQAKVDLTWDETDPNRIEVTEKLSSGKLDDLSQKDLQNYLASSSGEEDSDVQEKEESEDEEESKENVIDKYKALLLDIENKDTSKNNKDLEMEISWGINLKEKTDKLAKDKSSEDKTPFQQYLDKKKEKRKEKKKKKKEQKQDDEDSDMPSDIDVNDPYFAEEFNNPEFKKPKKQKKKVSNSDDEDDQKQSELELLLMNEDNKNHFSLKKIQESENDTKSKKKRKNKNKDDGKPGEDFEVNVKDERFSALFTSHHYNIDPTDPHFKKTKGMETLVNEKLKRRAEKGQEEVTVKKPKYKNAELSSLVKSVKRKTTEYMNK